MLLDGLEVRFGTIVHNTHYAYNMHTSDSKSNSYNDDSSENLLVAIKLFWHMLIQSNLQSSTRPKTKMRMKRKNIPFGVISNPELV